MFFLFDASAWFMACRNHLMKKQLLLINEHPELQNFYLPDLQEGKIQESLTPVQGWGGCFVMKTPSAAQCLS